MAFWMSPHPNTHRWTPIREPLQQSSWNVCECESAPAQRGPHITVVFIMALQPAILSGCQAPTKHFAALFLLHIPSGKHLDQNEPGEVCKLLGVWQPEVGEPRPSPCSLHPYTAPFVAPSVPRSKYSCCISGGLVFPCPQTLGVPQCCCASP